MIKNLLKIRLSSGLSKVAFFIIPWVPLVLFLAHFQNENAYLNQLDTQIELLHHKTMALKKQKMKESLALEHIQNADPNFLDKYLSSMPPISHHQNRALALHFIQENSRFFETLQENELLQQTPVEMYEEDLKRILSIVEGIPIGPYTPPPGRPSLLIKDFQLRKSSSETQDDVFLVKMDLLQRHCAQQGNTP